MLEDSHHHDRWLEEKCLTLLDKRKHANQDLIQMNEDIMGNVGHEAGRILG
jgi:hypothetical protein